MLSGERAGGRRAAGGYSYLLLLLGVAVFSAATAGAVQWGSALWRHDSEDELLATGEDFQRALQAYATANGAGRQCPQELQDLVRDPRVASPRRFLRRVPVDPLTGRSEWGLRRNPSGQIFGVYSLAPGAPLKRANFPPGMETAEGATTYADWVFGSCGFP